MINPWLGMALVLVALGGLMAGLRLYQRFWSPHPELVRKLLHMGMGLVTLSLPSLFDQAWPVLLLAALSVVGLLSLRFVGLLKNSLGNVVSGVGRMSLGEVYFPLAVTILFLLYLREKSQATPNADVLYYIPILLLTIADAAAALIGVSYGRLHYLTADGVKSWEGSLAFFTCAFFCAHLPLVFMTTTGKIESLLIAVLLAWLATMFEAIAWRGLDNLALPLVSFLLLKLYLTKSAGDLVSRLWVIAVLTIFLLLYRTRTTLVGSAVLGAILVGYVSWALGDWPWLLAPLTLFLCYTLLSPRTEANSQRIHNIHAVVAVTAAGLMWLFLAAIFNHWEFIFPYTITFAANLAIIGLARLRYDFPKLKPSTLLAICIAKGWFLIFLPYVVLLALSNWNLWALSLQHALLGLVGVSLAALAFYVLQPRLEDCPRDTARWLRQAGVAGAASMIGLVPLYWI